MAVGQMNAKYPSKKPCPNCGAEWAAGQQIYRDGGFAWCSNYQCAVNQGVIARQRQPQQQAPPAPAAAPPVSQPAPPPPVQAEPIPPLDDSTKEVVEREAFLLLQINNTVCEYLKPFMNEPNGPMIGQFTRLIYGKYFDNDAIAEDVNKEAKK